MKKNDVLRKCIVTGEVKEKTDLLRFVVTPELQVVPDLSKKLPGKGIYVTNSRQALETAVQKNLFAKACKLKAKTDKALVETVERVLQKRALDAVSLAKKAGILVLGLEKVLEVLKKGKVAFIVEAKDAGDDGKNRIALAAKDIEVFRLFSVEELDKALNKVNTVHAALVKSEMAQMVHKEFDKLAKFMNS